VTSPPYWGLRDYKIPMMVWGRTRTDSDEQCEHEWVEHIKPAQNRIDLIVPCIKAGAPEGGVVLDPFGGSGTTAEVSRRLWRRCISIELSEPYCKMYIDRLKQGEMLPI